MQTKEMTMNRKHMLVAGSGLVLALALGTGLAAAQTTTSGTQAPSTTTSTQPFDHNAMHDQMRAQMTAEQQAQCDAHHAQMGPGAGSTMMPGGADMMTNGMMR
jgi:hypothetical protein